MVGNNKTTKRIETMHLVFYLPDRGGVTQRVVTLRFT